MKSGKAAVRYAKSLMMLAREQGQLDAVQQDMEVIAQTVGESRDLELLLKSPVIKSDKKEDILNALFKGKVSEVSMGFVGIMVRKGREYLLAKAANEVVRMAKEAKHIYEATVTSAAPLNDATRTKVRGLVNGMAPEGATVELVEHVNPDLIGGFIVRYGDQMIDASVQTGIRALKRAFSENPFVPEF